MIIIAPDKFKGTMSATQAAESIARGLRQAHVHEELTICPMADGGDGTADVLSGLLPDGVKVVESHRYIGPEAFGNSNPMKRSSYAFGAAIARELAIGNRVLAAIGGTACCDGGAGLLQALGLRLFDSRGVEIKEHINPSVLTSIASVDDSELKRGADVIALSDVRASLLPSPGIALSALDFARQKGFSQTELPILANALAHWQKVMSVAPSMIDGAGGGIGYALAAVMGADVCSGASYILDLYAPDFRAASLVITGEGCIDAQTGGGKVVDAVVRKAVAAGTPVLAIGGRVQGT
ncbi:MAG: glycerate kinase, partial [Muribaculaceae bacterium]|nr:glycerate kinase [Muribaculaceae bacterium]